MQVSKRQKQKEQTRRKILDAAYRVFSRWGTAGTTAMIAREAGIAHGSVFVHFPTYNDLLACLFEDFGTRAGLRLHDAAEKGKSLEYVMSAHLDVLEEYEDFYTRLVTGMNLLPGEAKTTFVGFQSVVSLHFNKMIEMGIKAGTMKKIPQHMVLNTWIGLIHYYLQNRELFAPDASVIKRYRSELSAAFLKLISK